MMINDILTPISKTQNQQKKHSDKIRRQITIDTTAMEDRRTSNFSNLSKKTDSFQTLNRMTDKKVGSKKKVFQSETKLK